MVWGTEDEKKKENKRQIRPKEGTNQGLRTTAAHQLEHMLKSSLSNYP